MSLKDSGKLTTNALHLLSRLMDLDTDVLTVDLNLLENLNTNQSLNYIKLEEKLDTLEKNSNALLAIGMYNYKQLPLNRCY